MNTELYSALEDTTKKLAALKQVHTLIGRILLPVYGKPVNARKELARYVLMDANYKTESGYITENTKAYFKYFEDMYKDSELLSANALGTSREYEHFKDFPKIYNIYRKFAFYLYSKKFVLKENHSKDMNYNIPILYAPILAAFIRVLYFNKKLDKISAGQFLESVSVEIRSVIFKNMKFLFTDTDLGNTNTLELLYCFDLGILYEINSLYIGLDDPVIIPRIPSSSQLYHNYIVQLRQSSYGSFFTHVIEVYWKSIWKILTEECDYSADQNHFVYNAEPFSLIREARETESFINNKLLDKSHSRFNIVSDAFDKIDSCLGKHTTDEPLSKCFEQIRKVTENYLLAVENYNKNIIPQLAEQIYNKLDQLAFSRKDISIYHVGKEIMESDYAKAFHHIFGIYDMAATAIKYILHDKSLSDKNKYELLNTKILPELAARDKKDCFTRLQMECRTFQHIFKITNVAPINFESDIQEIKALFQIFCSPEKTAEEDLCGQFDRIVENIKSLCPDKNNCFSYIFQPMENIA